MSRLEEDTLVTSFIPESPREEYLRNEPNFIIELNE